MSEVFRTRSSRSNAFCRACAPFMIAFDVVRTAFVCHSVCRSVPSMCILWATSVSGDWDIVNVEHRSGALRRLEVYTIWIWIEMTTNLRENWESDGNMDPTMRRLLVLTSYRANLEPPSGHVYLYKLGTDELATGIRILLCWNETDHLRYWQRSGERWMWSYHGRAARLDILWRFVLCKSFLFLKPFHLNGRVLTVPLESASSSSVVFISASPSSFDRTLPGKIPQ